MKKGVDETFPRLLYDLFRVLGEFSVSCIPHQGFLKMHYHRHILVSRYHNFTYDIGNSNLTQLLTDMLHVICLILWLWYNYSKKSKTKLPRDVRSKSEIRKDCLNNRTQASPKMGLDQVSRGQSVTSRHTIPVSKIHWNPIGIWLKAKLQ